MPGLWFAGCVLNPCMDPTVGWPWVGGGRGWADDGSGRGGDHTAGAGQLLASEVSPVRWSVKRCACPRLSEMRSYARVPWAGREAASARFPGAGSTAGPPTSSCGPAPAECPRTSPYGRCWQTSPRPPASGCLFPASETSAPGGLCPAAPGQL